MPISKQNILQHLLKLIEERLLETEHAIASAKESRDSESKSSAGDKYETGRAMVQIELDNLNSQLNKNLALKEELLKINPEHNNEKASFGSLVETNSSTYFISVGLGKVDLENQIVYAVSLASPIGQALNQSQAGDTVSFNGNAIQILSVS